MASGLRRRYYGRVWAQATSDTKKYLRLEWLKFLLEEIVLIAALTAVLLVTGQPLAVAPFAAVLLALVIIPLLHLAWNLVSAPARLDAEKREQNGTFDGETTGGKDLLDETAKWAKVQFESLNLIQQEAMGQLLISGGMTESQMQDYLRAKGFDAGPTALHSISTETNLVRRDFEGRFTINPTLEEPLRTLSTARTQEDAATERLAVFFKAIAEPASNKAYELLGKICQLLMEKGKGSAESYVGILIQRFLADAQRAARGLLAQAFLTREEGRPRDYSREEVQHLFGSYYEMYQGMTSWIHQAGKLIGFSFDTDQAYRQWRKADDEFLRELRKLIAERNFKVLEQEVNAKGWQENFRQI